MTKYEAGQSLDRRASICEWKLKFTFLTKEQMVKFIKLLLKDELYHNFSTYVEEGTSLGQPQYSLELECSWAGNLSRIAKLLEKVDYELD